MTEYNFSPSELDYKAKKCRRCFYIYKNNPGGAMVMMATDDAPECLQTASARNT